MTTISTSYTLQMVTDLEAAIATGADSVTVDGRSVRYRSRREMEIQLNVMRRALGIITDTTVPPVRWARFVAVGDE
jgi:hypothetical protein